MFMGNRNLLSRKDTDMDLSLTPQYLTYLQPYKPHRYVNCQKFYKNPSTECLQIKASSLNTKYSKMQNEKDG